VDPFNHAHALDDGNSNVMIAQVAIEISRITAEALVAGLVLHHLRKGATGDADDLMGATMLRATFRAARILMRMTKAEAGTLKVPVEKAWRYSRIAGSKENYAPPPDRSTWYQFESIDLGNGTSVYPDGDNMQVVTPWPAPSAFHGLSKTDIAEIFAALRAGPSPGEHYAPDNRAPERWAGNLITARGQTDAAAKSLLKAWRKNKVVLEDKYYSKATHHDVAGLTLNEVMAAEILGARY
jgi:hypothetical protein